MLGNLIQLPRAPERETAASIDAAVAKALADMPGQLDVRLWVDHEEREAFTTAAAPVNGEVMVSRGKRVLVYLVRRAAPNRFEAYALTLSEQNEASKW